MEKDKLISPTGAKVGDKVVLIKGVPIEATAIIAREKAKELLDRGYLAEFIAKAQGYLRDPGISVVRAARIAADHPGVHAMHDPTEGGVATGLHELAFAARAGLRLDADAVPILPEARQLCDEFGLDPLGAIASGALLVAVEHDKAESLCQVLGREEIPAHIIGELLPAHEGIYMVRGGQILPLPRFDSDEITKIFEVVTPH